MEFHPEACLAVLGGDGVTYRDTLGGVTGEELNFLQVRGGVERASVKNHFASGGSAHGSPGQDNALHGARGLGGGDVSGGVVGGGSGVVIQVSFLYLGWCVVPSLDSFIFPFGSAPKWV